MRRLLGVKARAGTKDIAYRLNFLVLEDGEELTILYTRHLVIFDSQRRYPLSRSVHLSGNVSLL